MTRVFIAAVAPATRVGLRALLDAPGLEVVGDGASLLEHLEELRDTDVIVVGDDELLAAVMEDGGGERALAILALTEDHRPLGALARARLSGWGILSREVPAAELQAAVLAVAQGLIVLPASLGPRLLGPNAAEEEMLDRGPLPEPLTAREREVLELLSQGLPNREIARRLGISEHTAKFHVSSIYGKLGVQSRTEAVTRGIRHGLVIL